MSNKSVAFCNASVQDLFRESSGILEKAFLTGVGGIHIERIAIKREGCWGTKPCRGYAPRSKISLNSNKWGIGIQNIRGGNVFR